MNKSTLRFDDKSCTRPSPASLDGSKVMYVVKKVEGRQPGNEAGVAPCHLTLYCIMDTVQRFLKCLAT